MVATPILTPVTIPDDEFTVAMDVLLLDHDPPVIVCVNGVDAPLQTLALPVMVPGVAVMVIAAVARQPDKR